MQDLRRKAALIVASCMAADCVVNSSKYPNKLEVARKVNAYNTKAVGLSRDDLPSTLRLKFDA